jgi:nucleoside-diphosphate-sugar epimerase
VDWPAERSALEIGDAVVSSRRIRAELGWAPLRDLEAGLGDTRAYFSTRLDAYL